MIVNVDFCDDDDDNDEENAADDDEEAADDDDEDDDDDDDGPEQKHSLHMLLFGKYFFHTHTPQNKTKN